MQKNNVNSIIKNIDLTYCNIILQIDEQIKVLKLFDSEKGYMKKNSSNTID